MQVIKKNVWFTQSSGSLIILLFLYFHSNLDVIWLLFFWRGEGKKAADCLRTALREYNLKFGTILNDPDLASFRALPEFKELQEEVFYLVLKDFVMLSCLIFMCFILLINDQLS